MRCSARGCGVAAAVGGFEQAKQRVSAETQERTSKSRGMNHQQVAIEQTKRR